MFRNWKLIVHLLLGTKRFGVNNQKFSGFDSMFARTEKLTLRVIMLRYKMVKHRATVCGFLTREECENLGWESEI